MSPLVDDLNMEGAASHVFNRIRARIIPLVYWLAFIYLYPCSTTCEKSIFLRASGMKDSKKEAMIPLITWLQKLNTITVTVFCSLSQPTVKGTELGSISSLLSPPLFFSLSLSFIFLFSCCASVSYLTKGNFCPLGML